MAIVYLSRYTTFSFFMTVFPLCVCIVHTKLARAHACACSDVCDAEEVFRGDGGGFRFSPLERFSRGTFLVSEYLMRCATQLDVWHAFATSNYFALFFYRDRFRMIQSFPDIFVLLVLFLPLIVRAIKKMKIKSFQRVCCHCNLFTTTVNS